MFGLAASMGVCGVGCCKVVRCVHGSVCEFEKQEASLIWKVCFHKRLVMWGREGLTHQPVGTR